MEALLRKELALTSIKPYGRGGGGCINEGRGFDTEKGQIYVKSNSKKEAKLMFNGEFASLGAILATATVRVPKPMKVLPHPSTEGAILVTEYLDMRGLSSHAGKLGEQLARMHLSNAEQMTHREVSDSRVVEGTGAECVTQFGFHVTTCCGFIPQDNDWCDDWVKFYSRNRLKYQLDLIERDYGDCEARELWPQLERKIPGLFEGVDVKPALLHGDLWGGNVAETSTEPVIFDPASFYGHSEYELGIAGMFGGLSRSFYEAYHKVIPKAPGFDKRHELYKLFHYLNHWNHFGTGYRGSAISIMRSLVR